MAKRARWRILAVAAAMEAAGFSRADASQMQNAGAGDIAPEFAVMQQSRVRKSKDYRFALRLASGSGEQFGSPSGARQRQSGSACIRGQF